MLVIEVPHDLLLKVKFQTNKKGNGLDIQVCDPTELKLCPCLESESLSPANVPINPHDNNSLCYQRTQCQVSTAAFALRF